MAASTLAIISAVSSIAGVYTGFRQQQAQKKAGKAERAALDANRRADEVKQARERRRALQEARRAAAVSRQGAANQGATGSSSAQGGVASVVSQGYSNANYLDTVGNLTNQANAFNIQSSNYMSQANAWKGYGEAAAAAPGIYEGIQSIFDTPNN